MDLVALASWFDEHRRALPWREPGTTAWGVLVSEVMLQQTPVARVESAWRAWLERWPTPQDLAQSSVADALRQWGTLGYPRRARNLHQQAVLITDQFGGHVPSDPNLLETLPGIGPYTARAVASFAFGAAHPVADTNVNRVLARSEEGVAGSGHWGSREGMARVEAVLNEVSTKDYPRLNLAMMELGALVCQARVPLCERCPLATSCAWKREGYPVEEHVLPKRQARYEGSDRQARGRILAKLRAEPGGLDRTELLAGAPSRSQASRALESLVADNLVTEVEGRDEPRYTLRGD